MKYSEAIRLGGMLRPKCRFEYYSKETGGVCVQGAALDAIGCLEKGKYFENLERMVEHFPETCICYVTREDILSIAPELNTRYLCSPMAIRAASVFLNDYTNLTRNQIADLVESLENKYHIYETPQEQEMEVPCPSTSTIAV